MALTFTSVPHRDISKGIDSRSPLNRIADGYAEDLVNVKTNSEGFLQKRPGYQGFSGHIPLRAISVSRTGTTLTFTFDSSVDLSDVDATTIIVAGKLSAAQTGDFTNTYAQQLYTTFTPATNSFTVTDSASGSYTDTAPEICVWGISTASFGDKAGHISALASYQREGESRLMAVRGGTIYGSYLRDELSGQLDTPSTTVSLAATTVASTINLAPAFWNTLDTPTRTRGFIRGDNVAGNFAEVTAGVWSGAGTTTNYTLTFANRAITGSLASLITSDDWLLVTDMGHSRMNGRFKITSVTDLGGDQIQVSVTNTAITTPYYDDSNTGGRAGVFTDVIATTVNNLEAGDRVFAAAFDPETDIITVQEVDGANLILEGIIGEYSLNTASFTGRRTSTNLPVADDSNFLLTDLVRVGDYDRNLRVMELAGSDILVLDEAIEVTHGDTVIVPNRWFPIEIAPTTSTLATPTQSRLFDMETYGEQSRVRTALINDSLFLTNGVDEVMKFDGTSAYRAGISRWQPTALFFYNTEVPSIFDPAYQYPYDSATVATGLVVGDDGVFSSLEVGDKLYELPNSTTWRGGRFTVIGKPTTTTIQLSGELSVLSTAASTLYKISSYKYYFRLNAIDSNNNIIASGVTGKDDFVIEIVPTNSAGGQIHIRLVGLPEFGPIDWDRLELEVYRTARDTVAPFYRVATRQVNIGPDTQYLDIFDSVTNAEVLGDLDIPSTKILGEELGNAWDGPVPSKYIASIGNRLVLGNLKSWPEFDITLRRNADSTKSYLDSAATFEFLRDEDVVSGTTDMATRVTFETVQDTFVAEGTVTANTATDQVTFLGTPAKFPNDRVRFTAATMPSPLQAGTTYYTTEHTITTKLAPTPGSSTIDLLTAGATIVGYKNLATRGAAISTIYADGIVSFGAGTDDISFNSTGILHPSVGDRVVFEVLTPSVLPVEVVAGTDYYISAINGAAANPSGFSIAATAGGPSIIFSASTGFGIARLRDKFFVSSTEIRSGGTSYGNNKIPDGARNSWIYLFPLAIADLGRYVVEQKGFQLPMDVCGWFPAAAYDANDSVTAISSPNRRLKQSHFTFTPDQVNVAADTITLPGVILPVSRARFYNVGGGLPAPLVNTTSYSLTPHATLPYTYTVNAAITTQGTGTHGILIELADATTSNTVEMAALVASDSRNVPIFGGANDLAEWERWRSTMWVSDGTTTLTPEDDRDARWALRVSSAINAVMRTATPTLFPGFTPWLQAFAGSDYGTNRLLVRRPKTEAGLPQMISSAVDTTAFTIFINGLRRDNGDTVSAQEPVYPSRLLVSYKNYPEIFDNPTGTGSIDSDSIADVNAADGQELTGIASFFGDSAFGAANLSNVLVAFKTESIYVVDLSDDPARPASANRAVQKLNTQGKGCTFPDSIVSTNIGIMFANDSGIYRLNRDFSISYVGKMMEGQWKRVNKAARLEAVATLSPLENDYRLSIPLVGEDTNSEVFRYDYEREGGDQQYGAWSRYTNYPVTSWTTLNGEVYFGDTSGQVFIQRSANDVTDYRDDADAVAEMVVKYKPVDFGEPAMKKVLAGVITEFTEDSDMDGTTLSISIDGRDNPQEVADYTIEFQEESDALSDVPPRRIQTVIATPVQRRGMQYQLVYQNSTKDEAVTLAGFTFVVAGLPLAKGLVEASSDNQA